MISVAAHVILYINLRLKWCILHSYLKWRTRGGGGSEIRGGVLI